MGDEKNTVVFLVSNHGYQHVLNKLRLYQKYIPVRGYLCASDTIYKDLHDLPSGNKLSA
ncbi:hypothetical protein IIA15_01745 [candidate division TA06 bacterium]|nr:hypothetical protein [candidate division TA06 bacterium]